MCIRDRLLPYFANRVQECHERIAAWGELLDGDDDAKHELQDRAGTKVDQLQHTPGTLNISDLGTRGHATTQEISFQSEWQTGPLYLAENRSTWPISRTFSQQIPENERKSKIFKLINSVEVKLPNVEFLDIEWGHIES